MLLIYRDVVQDSFYYLFLSFLLLSNFNLTITPTYFFCLRFMINEKIDSSTYFGNNLLGL